MNDKKASDDEFFEENFNEEFDFGEENFDTSPTSTGGGSPKKGPGKPIVFLVLFVVLGVAGYFGYKFYGASPGKMPSLISQVSPKLETKLETKKTTDLKDAATKSIADTQPVELTQTTQTSIAKVEPVPVVAPLPTEIAQPQNPETKAVPVAVPVLNEKDLVKLLGKPGDAPKPAEIPPTTVTTAQTPATVALPTTPMPPISPTDTTIPAVTTPPTPTVKPDVTSPKNTVATITDIKKAIEAQKSPQVSSSTPTTPTPGVTPEKSLTIQEMQRDLFAVEPKAGVPIPPTPPVVQQVPVPPVVVAEAQAPQVKDVREQIKETMDSLTRVNQQMENNLNQIKNLDAYTREVSHTVAKLNADISAMDNRVLALTKTANSLSKEIGNIQGEVGASRTDRGMTDRGMDRSIRRSPGGGVGPAVLEAELDVTTVQRPKRIEQPTILLEEPEYVVHAVIPGRAWLKSSKGQILTITEGDSLGNYGKILVIDAASGVVLTSSGITFR